MYANFEIVAYKNGVRTVRTYTLKIYQGIAAALYERYSRAGYYDISVRMF